MMKDVVRASTTKRGRNATAFIYIIFIPAWRKSRAIAMILAAKSYTQRMVLSELCLIRKDYFLPLNAS